MEPRSANVRLEALDGTVDEAELVVAHPVMAPVFAEPVVARPAVVYPLEARAGDKRELFREVELLMQERRAAEPVEVALYWRTEAERMVLAIPVVSKIHADGEFVPEAEHVHLVDVPRREIPAVRIVLEVAIRAEIPRMAILVGKPSVDEQPLVFGQPDL